MLTNPGRLPLITYGAIGLLAAAYAAIANLPNTPWVGATSGFVACAILWRENRARAEPARSAHFLLATAVAFLLVPLSGLWVVPTVSFLAIALLRPGLLLPEQPLPIKRKWSVLLGATILTAGSIGGLTWWRATKTFLVVDWMPEWLSPELYGAIFVLAAITNSTFEEHLWRGALTDLLPRGVLGPIFVATCFALTHYASLPNGVTGVAITFAFSLAASGLRTLSNGSLAPLIVSHFCADIYLFAITQ